MKTKGGRDELILNRSLCHTVREGSLASIESLLTRGANPNEIALEGRNALHWAAYKKQHDIIALFLAHGAEIDSPDVFGATTLIYAIFEEDEELALDLIERGANIHARSCLGDTPLNCAVFCGLTRVVEKLVTIGVDLRNEPEILAEAIKKRNETLAHNLIEAGLAFDGRSGVDALSEAAYKGFTSLVSLLLKRGVDPDREEINIKHPLCAAAAGNQIEMMEWLLNAGIGASRGSDALYCALESGAKEATLYLLRRGVSPQENCLKWACHYGFIEIVCELIAQTETIDEQSMESAIYQGHIAIVVILMIYSKIVAEGDRQKWLDFNREHRLPFPSLFESISPYLTEEDLGLLLITAINQENPNKDLVQFLIEEGAPINFLYESLYFRINTPLLAAVFRNHVDIALLLLNKGADLNLGSRGITPLFIAIDYQLGQLAKIFIEAGADTVSLLQAIKSDCLELVDHLVIDKELSCIARDHEGNTPLHILASDLDDRRIQVEGRIFNQGWYGKPFSQKELEEERVTIARRLIDCGADPNALNDEGLSPLHVAVQNDRLELIPCLIDCGADVNLAAEGSMLTPLHFAHSPRCIELLIEKGACIEAKDANGLTPLHLAVKEALRYEPLESVLALMEEGADVQTRALDGSTLLMTAEDEYPTLREFHKFLIKLGAR